jgi:hypothetical protein
MGSATLSGRRACFSSPRPSVIVLSVTSNDCTYDRRASRFSARDGCRAYHRSDIAALRGSAKDYRTKPQQKQATCGLQEVLSGSPKSSAAQYQDRCVINWSEHNGVLTNRGSLPYRALAKRTKHLEVAIPVLARAEPDTSWWTPQGSESTTRKASTKHVVHTAEKRATFLTLSRAIYEKGPAERASCPGRGQVLTKRKVGAYCCALHNNPRSRRIPL